MTNLTMKVKVKVNETFRRSMNSLIVMVKFQMGQFISLKLIFCKISDQFELEGQGQVHQFLK